MIIVSQDRTRIVNFETVEILGINLDNTKQIGVSFSKGCFYLGTYKTEERAKEVLQEIIQNIYPKSNVDMDIDGISFGVQSPVYEMPLK